MSSFLVVDVFLFFISITPTTIPITTIIPSIMKIICDWIIDSVSLIGSDIILKELTDSSNLEI